MIHKYNMPTTVASLLSMVGYKGLPYPGRFLPRRPEGTYKGDSQEDYEISTTGQEKEYAIGTRLYAQDALGRWHFMPVTVKYTSQKTEEESKPVEVELELECAIINITGKKNIVETPLIGKKGSVKELISTDDYKISIAAFITSGDGTYPADKIKNFMELYNCNETVELICALTDLVFDENDKAVITSISFPPTPGVEDAQAIKLELTTDQPFELIKD